MSTNYPPLALAFRHDRSTWFSRVITRVAGGPVHVAVIFGPRCIEAVEGEGVRSLQTADRLRFGNWTVVPVPHGDVAKALAFANDEKGSGYDYLGVVWSWMVGRIGGNGSRHRWFCSEFAAAVLDAAGVTLGVKRYAYYTPARLWRATERWRA